jgi:maltose O-acetyltransferase
LVTIENLVELVIDRLFSTSRLHGPKDRLILAEGAKTGDALFNTRCGTITVGKGTHFGHGVRLLTGAHDPTDPDFALDTKDRSISVGENCWLCSYSIILGPCKIGDGCVIGAGAVVTKDCEPGWLYVGNPAFAKKEV